MTEVHDGRAERSDLARVDELVLVCCHGVYVGDGGSLDESQWLLPPFCASHAPRHKRGEHETFTAHIVTAALAVHRHPGALLVFSGGQTTPHPRSEAEAYGVALQHLVRHNAALFPAGVRYALERHATDSYQNLLFSAIRFRQLTGRYPATITVVTHAFKERRFLELHAPAIKWPAHRIRVQGLNPPFSLDELAATQRAEHERAYRPFAADPYAARAPLTTKRLARNWNADRAHVFLAFRLEPEVVGLLQWQGGVGGRETYPARLPWEEPRSSPSSPPSARTGAPRGERAE